MRDDRIDKRINECDGASLNKPEFFLKHALSRTADAANTRPDPGCGDVVSVLVEFVVEERFPEPIVYSRAAPADDPFFRRCALNRRPGVSAHRYERKQTVA